MTVVVATAALPRTRGFLASCMLELAPGVYTSPRMSKAVRERVWAVVKEWYEAEPQGSLVMTWPDKSAGGGQAVAILGAPPVVLCDHDGLILARR